MLRKLNLVPLNNNFLLARIAFYQNATRYSLQNKYGPIGDNALRERYLRNNPDR